MIGTVSRSTGRCLMRDREERQEMEECVCETLIHDHEIRMDQGPEEPHIKSSYIPSLTSFSLFVSFPFHQK